MRCTASRRIRSCVSEWARLRANVTSNYSLRSSALDARDYLLSRRRRQRSQCNLRKWPTSMGISRKLRIAFVTPEYVTEDYFDGGLANYINRTSRLLAERGHDVHVVTLSRRDEKEFDHDGVMVHRVMLKPSWQVVH